MSAVSGGRPRGGRGELADCCQWVLEAEESQDAQHLGGALAALYEYLTGCGWTPPPSAALILHLREGCFEAEVDQLFTAPEGL